MFKFDNFTNILDKNYKKYVVESLLCRKISKISHKLSGKNTFLKIKVSLKSLQE